MNNHESEAKHPRIPQHTLLRQIGPSHRGDVWLACDVTGAFRAIKIVRQGKFPTANAFGWERHDVTEHLPVTQAHDGLVTVLDCSEIEEERFFYYVMELGDDENASISSTAEAEIINPETYQPRALSRQGQLPRLFSIHDCWRIAVKLSGTLAWIHQQGLICPGLKSSKVLFVRGVPKLSGVTRAATSGALDEVGRNDCFKPPEGWGTSRADVFSLGKIIYEMATGLEASRFPEWPPNRPANEKGIYSGFKRVVLKACAKDPNKRHANGQALLADLQAIEGGFFSAMSGWKMAAAAAVVAALIWGGLHISSKKTSDQEIVSPIQPVSRAVVQAPVPVSAPLSENIKPSLKPSLSDPLSVTPEEKPVKIPSAPVIPPVFETVKTLWSDDFDTDSSSQWTVQKTSDDTAAKFAWDYSAMGIPTAPGAIQPRGLYLAANQALPKSQEAICLSPVGQQFLGSYRLKFQLWMNTIGPFPRGGLGSTQFILMGVETEGDRLHNIFAMTTEDGIWFTANGDGDSNSTADYTAYRANHLFGVASPHIYGGGAGEQVRGNEHPYFATFFLEGQKPPAAQTERYPSLQIGNLAPGSLGFAWRNVEIIKLEDRVTWIIDGLPFAAVNLNGAIFGHNIFVGYADYVNSVAVNPELCFAVVDNLVVEEIRPGGQSSAPAQ